MPAHTLDLPFEVMFFEPETLEVDAPTQETDSQGRRSRLDEVMLAAARKQAASREILLWMTPSEAPKALQASECSELLDPVRASCWIFAQH